MFDKSDGESRAMFEVWFTLVQLKLRFLAENATDTPCLPKNEAHSCAFDHR